MTTTRVLVVPAQDAAGAADERAWLTRFDSLFTARLHDGGIGAGWAYARDAVRFQRQNPTYLTDARLLGAQPLAASNVKDGMTLPDPFAMRVRAYTGLANSRTAIVPVLATIDSAATPPTATLRIVIIDSPSRKIVAATAVTSPFSGDALAAADSLATAAARLFVHVQ
jgi:hypothetical protein